MSDYGITWFDDERGKRRLAVSDGKYTAILRYPGAQWPSHAEAYARDWFQWWANNGFPEALEEP